MPLETFRLQRLVTNASLLGECAHGAAAHDGKVDLADGRLQLVGSLLVDGLGEDQDDGHFLGELADDFDVVVLHPRLTGVHAVPEQVDVLFDRRLPRFGDHLLEVADDPVLRVAEFHAFRVVERHGDARVLEALDDLRDWPAGFRLRQRLAKHGVDERALTHPCLPDDEDVRVPEPLHLPLTLARKQLVGAEFGVIECGLAAGRPRCFFVVSDALADVLPCSPESVGGVLASLNSLATLVEASL